MRTRLGLIGLALVVVVVGGLFLVTRGPGGNATEFQVSPTAATEIDLGSGARLIIPAQSIDGPGQLRITRPSATPKPAASIEQPFEMLQGPYEFELIGASLIGDALLEIPIAGLNLPAGAAPEDVFVATLNDGAWLPVPNAVDQERGVLVARISHFSIFGVFALVAEWVEDFFRTVLEKFGALFDLAYGGEAPDPICRPEIGPPTVLVTQGTRLFKYCSESASQQPGDLRTRLVNDRLFSLIVTPPAAADVDLSAAGDLASALPALFAAAVGQALVRPGDEVAIGQAFPTIGVSTQRTRVGPSTATMTLDFILTAGTLLIPGGTSTAELLRTAKQLNLITCVVEAGYDNTFDPERLLTATLGCFIRGGSSLTTVVKLAVTGVVVNAVRLFRSAIDALMAQVGQVPLIGDLGGSGTSQWYVDVTYVPPRDSSPSHPPSPSPTPPAAPTAAPTPLPTPSLVVPPSEPTNVVWSITPCTSGEPYCHLDTVTWTPSGSTQEGFHVYESWAFAYEVCGANVISLIATVPASATSYSQELVGEGPGPCYWVSAFNSAGESALVLAVGPY